MAESLRIPATQAPTFFNRSALAGFGLGLATVGPLFGLIPAVIGAYMGYSEMQTNIERGKTVEKPGLFKKEAVKDGLIWAGVVSFAVSLAAVAGFIAFGSAAALAAPGALATAGIAVAAAVIAAPVVGFLYGASSGKSRMAKEWAQAEAYVRDRGEYRTPEQVQAQAHVPTRGHSQQQASQPETSYKNSVSASEERELQERMRANQKEFAAMRMEEKAAAVDSVPAR